ncbi:ABC transporter ATP-binding protein [Marinitoga arctica]
MLKLMKYLKPYTLFLILAIAFLYIQARVDLALPDYMSNIVNVGIQQNGIEDTIPKAIRDSQMKNLFIFMSNDEKTLILENFKYIKSSDENFKDYMKLYPNLKNEKGLYVFEGTENNKLEEIFAKSFLAVSGIEKGETEGLNINTKSKINIFKLLNFIPLDQRINFANNLYEKIKITGDEMVRQSLILSVKNEYEKLGVDLYKQQRNYILKSGSIMLLITLLGALMAIVVGFFASKTAAGLAKDLREKVFTKVENFAGEEFDKFSTASLITRTTNDITQIQNVMVILIRIMFYAPILSVGAIFKALDKSPSLSWIIALAVAVLISIIGTIFYFALPKFKLFQKLVDKLNLVSRENLTGMMVIRAFNTQNKEKERFDSVNTEITKTQVFIGRLMSFLMPVMMFVMNSVMLLIIWFGAKQVDSFSIQVGDMMAFMQYSIQVIFSFLMMTMIFIFLPRASVSANRVAEVLDTKPSIIDPENPKSFDENIKGEIEFKNVYFKYPGAEDYALKNISFKALPGQVTAIIGSTGSGKSSLVNLIPRLYDVTEGQVLIDGIDVRELTQNELRKYIGYVPQKATLFSGTIETNIKYGNKNLSDNEMERVADVAEALEFINRFPERFKHEVSQGGSNLSGGQKQRLSIARALAKKPKIYVFDDSFSALDFKTDLNVRKKLREYTKNSTFIIVAQRIATIMNAEQIIVLDEGEIVGIGTHNELLKSCPVYREIAYSQLSEEELA